MKRRVKAFDCARTITEALPGGILLNTNGDKFNSMVIGWGHIGVIWGMPTFVVYVRQSRYTKRQLDMTGEFTISAPLNGRLDPDVFRICGTLSGRDIDKEKEAGLTLVKGEATGAPGIAEYPLTLECRVLYKQDQRLSDMPADIVSRFYTNGADDGDFHTMYIGRIVDSYIIEEDGTDE